MLIYAGFPNFMCTDDLICYSFYTSSQYQTYHFQTFVTVERCNLLPVLLRKKEKTNIKTQANTIIRNIKPQIMTW